MTVEWIIIECLAVFVENFIKIYFIDSQLTKRFDNRIAFALMLFVSVSWGLFATFTHVNQIIYITIAAVLLFAGVCVFTTATLSRKIFVVLLATAISYVTSFLGAGIIGLVVGRTFHQIVNNQDTARLLAIIFVKTLQTIVFLFMAKRPFFDLRTGRTPAIILFFNSVLCLAIEFLIWFYISSTPVAAGSVNIFVAASVCSALILAAGFIMYEVFARQEQERIELSNSLQRSGMETTFREEIRGMHSDLQTWRHEYKNNLLALRGYVADEDVKKALSYIDEIAESPLIGTPLITTNNPALDAVINSKLWLAENRGIAVSAQSAFPDEGIPRVTDSDLCSIVGNLLDNSIEACGRMPEGERQFLTFELLVRGYNIFVSIYNSFDGKITRDGEAFVSSKGTLYNGIGLKYVDAILAKYDGYAMREYKNGVFSTQVMIPLLDPDGGKFIAKSNSWFGRFLGGRRSHTRK